MIVRAITAGTGNVVAAPARQRNYLAIYNQSATATVYIAFDTAAVAAATAGQITIGPVGAAAGPTNPGVVFAGSPQTIPWNQINIISTAASTPVTILE